MRSKFSVSHSERVANADKTIEVFGLTLEKNTSVPAAFYHARLTDAELATFLQRNTNSALDVANVPGEVRGLRLVRFSHAGEPYTSVTISADKAIDLIASGDAVEGIALQPAIAG